MGIVDRREVVGCGPHDAKIAIIGEAPGATEERVGRPFVGTSGRFLDMLLEKNGIIRDECYIDNVVRIRPPNNQFSVLPKDVVEAGEKRLRVALKIIKPNVIIAMGNPALHALTGLTGISKYRGSIINGLAGKVVPTYHPAWILKHSYGNKPLVEFDLRRALVESESSDVNLPQTDFTLDPSLEVALQLLHDAESAEYLSFDIETIYGTPAVTAIGFSTSINTAFSIPFRLAGHERWTEVEELKLWSSVTKLLESPKPKKIAQNVMFDAHVLHSVLGIDIVNFWIDTMLLHNVLYSELPKGLDLLCSLYTRHPYYKDMHKRLKTDEAFLTYNALDACVTLECALKMRQEAEEFEVWDYYCKHVNPLIWPLLQMQYKGVRVDLDARREAVIKVSSIVADYEGTLKEVVGRDVNVNSSKQMKELIYEDIGLPVQRKRGTNAVTTDEEALNELKRKFPDNPELDLILRIRREKKLLGTYLTNPIDEDNRMRCSYNIAGTEGARISSSKTPFNTGGNLQNVPDGIARRVLIADEGKMLLNVDLSRAETWVVAYSAQESAMIEILNDTNADFHEEVSKMVFGTGDKRQLAKRLGHAANYGMGVLTFAREAGIPTAEAKIALPAYQSTFSRLGVWHMQIQEAVRRTRMLTTPFGRKRIFFGRLNNVTFRDAYAFIPQSTVADVLHEVLMHLYACIPNDVDILLHVHDSLLLQMPPTREEEMRDVLHRAFKVPVTIHRRTFTIPAGIKVGNNWNEIK